MEEIISKIKKGAAIAVDEAQKVTKSVVKFSSDAVNQTKLKYAIKDNQNKVNEILAAIGSYVYDSYKEGAEFEGDIADKCAQISVLNDEIASLNERVAELKNSVICPSCNEYNKADSVYCSKCGNKFEK